MSTSLNSINQLDLSPLPGKKYWNSGRQMQDEVIYFLLTDRFSSGEETIVELHGRQAKGYGNVEELNYFYGGTLKGIIGKLDYLKGLGITAIGLSPVFENNPNNYHGYATQNYLMIDPHFGTKEDLQELIEQAHFRSLKIFLDVVINHTGDNWSYKRDLKPWYSKGKKYSFGSWRNEHLPVPVELRNEKYYRQEGMIRNWDAYPETESGDFFVLKKLDFLGKDGHELMKMFIRIYSWWIKETDCDGFRIDALKHLGSKPADDFCAGIKSYCSAIGKTEFLIFGELILGDTEANHFLASTTSGRFSSGVDTLFDFPLHFTLPGIIRGEVSLLELMNRYLRLEEAAKARTAGKYLINFMDNHDQVGQKVKKRIGADLSDKQLEAALGILFCLPGIPSLYYGTEQWLCGQGEQDQYIREAMFCKNEGKSLHNSDHYVYKIIRNLCRLREENKVLREGSIHFNEISSDGKRMGNYQESKVLVFSRISENEQIVVIYNTDINIEQNVLISLQLPSDTMDCIYGTRNKLSVSRGRERGKDLNFLKIGLEPSEFVILK